MDKKAFTLIELVMVIAVIALLAAIIIPRFTVQIVEARISTTKANLQTLRSALNLFYANEGAWPDEANGLDDLITASAATVTGTQYLRAIPPETILGSNNTTVRVGSTPNAQGGWLYHTNLREIYVNYNTTVPNSGRSDVPGTDW